MTLRLLVDATCSRRTVRVQVVGLGVPGQPAAVFEQWGIVGGDALQQRFHGAFDLCRAERRVSEERTVVHQ